MKLSEAIRLGSMLRPQGFLELSSNGRTCALGAAGEAIGVVDRNGWAPWYLAFPVLMKSGGDCPQDGCSDGGKTCGTLVLHLNDDHHWTREQIADWVATIEPVDVVAEPLVPSIASVQ